jgi:uncharacterized membrane protein YphA (DoxX/SURF4 family)
MPPGGRLAALVRIATGVLFVTLGLEKIVGSFVRGGFAKDVASTLATSWPFWRSFLQSTVAGNAAVFAWIVAAGELVIGLALLLGLGTRAAAVGGALLMLVILLGQSYPGPKAPWDRWITSGLATRFALLLLLLLAASDAGRVWGLDGRRGSGFGVRRGSLRR